MQHKQPQLRSAPKAAWRWANNRFVLHSLGASRFSGWLVSECIKAESTMWSSSAPAQPLEPLILATFHVWRNKKASLLSRPFFLRSVVSITFEMSSFGVKFLTLNHRLSPLCPVKKWNIDYCGLKVFFVSLQYSEFSTNQMRINRLLQLNPKKTHKISQSVFQPELISKPIMIKKDSCFVW